MGKVRRGYIIAFFGPDGSGKSTVADLFEKANQANGLDTARFHWRPRILPGFKKSEAVSITQPDNFSTRSWVVSVAMYFYIFCDFLLGYLLKLYPLVSQGNVVVYERYFYDLLFHPRRYKLLQVPRLSNWLAKLVPKPQFIVLLTGDPSLIRARKPELPLGEIIKQQTLMRDYLESLGTIIHLDTTACSSVDTTISVCQHVGLPTDVLQKLEKY